MITPYVGKTNKIIISCCMKPCFIIDQIPISNASFVKRCIRIPSAIHLDTLYGIWYVYKNEIGIIITSCKSRLHRTAIHTIINIIHKMISRNWLIKPRIDTSTGVTTIFCYVYNWIVNRSLRIANLTEGNNCQNNKK